MVTKISCVNTTYTVLTGTQTLYKVQHIIFASLQKYTTKQTFNIVHFVYFQTFKNVLFGNRS